MTLAEDIRALAQKRRSRPNLEKVQAQLDELRELADSAEYTLQALESAREALSELSGALDDDGNPLLSWSAEVREAADALLALLPEEGESPSELISEAEEIAEEYESCLDDRDYSADGREEIWGNLMDAMENIAGALG
jgi:division protein CdvB (Snf7/Vps24/ESCRT-III family)